MKSKTKNEFGYKLLTPLMRILFRLYYNPKIINKEYIPKKGSIIIAGNHLHAFDQCLTIMATRRMIHYMAKKEYFDGYFACFFKFVGCISVNRNQKDSEAKEKALDVLRKNGAIGIFPEGTRNKTKKILLPLKYGAVSLAKKTDSYIIPFGISGNYKFRSKNLKITYGKPFKVGNMSLEEANEKLTKEITKLIKKSGKTDC